MDPLSPPTDAEVLDESMRAVTRNSGEASTLLACSHTLSGTGQDALAG